MNKSIRRSPIPLLKYKKLEIQDKKNVFLDIPMIKIYATVQSSNKGQSKDKEDLKLTFIN